MKKRASSAGMKKTSSGKSPSVRRRRLQKSKHVHTGVEALPNGTTDHVQSETGVPASSLFRMDSKPKRYIPIMTTVIALGITSLYLYFEILLKLHNYYTLILVIPLYGYIFGDLIVWMRTGIRSLEIESGELRLTLPNGQPVKRIGKNEIGSVRITSTIDGRTVYILLHGATASKFLWMNFYSGPRFRIPEAPFNKSDFVEFVDRLGTIATVVR